jgi:hypothetical protein
MGILNFTRKGATYPQARMGRKSPGAMARMSRIRYNFRLFATGKRISRRATQGLIE